MRLTELLVRTKKGLFLLDGEPGSSFEIATRAFAGEPVDFAHSRFAQRAAAGDGDLTVLRAEDLLYRRRSGRRVGAGGRCRAAPRGRSAARADLGHRSRGGGGTVYAGGDPGVLLESRDGGANWEINAGLWEQPSRSGWQPGGGGLCLHSICTWPGDPDKLAVAVSAAGIWLTDDGGVRGGGATRGSTRGTCPRRR
jgi:hypothetical protein